MGDGGEPAGGFGHEDDEGEIGVVEEVGKEEKTGAECQRQNPGDDDEGGERDHQQVGGQADEGEVAEE